MTAETYKGISLRVQKGSRWGYCKLTVAGVPFGEWLGRDELAHLESMKRTVDAAVERPEAYGPEWKAAEANVVELHPRSCKV